MKKTVGDFLIERLHAWGVRRVFGYSGDGINGILGALARAHGAIEFVQVRHEEMAAFAACGHAKYTGEVGVCLATSGPGATHLVTGLYDALADHQSVVAIVGQKPRMALGSSFQQEIDLPALFKDVAREYVETVMTPAQVRHVIDRAFRTALAEHCPTCIIVPQDVQELPARDPPHEHGAAHSGVGYTAPKIVPEAGDLQRAADLLNAGQRVAMLVGAGARGATREVLAVAEKLGAGVAKALLGKPVVPDSLPYVTGGIGLLGTRASYELMQHCDTLLMVGSDFPYSEFLPEEGKARGVQIDIDARRLSLRYPMEVNLVGDSAATLAQLFPLLDYKEDRRWRERIERSVAKWWETLEHRAMQDGDPINPQRVFWELSPRLPDDILLACDTGTSVHWYSRDIRMREGMLAAHSGGLASMGAAMPYAIAGKFAFPDRPVMAFVGDGAMQMNGMNELITVAKYWKQWRDPRFMVLVLNNRDLDMVTWEQRVLEGDPKFSASQDLPDVPYAEYARMLGLAGLRIEHPSQIPAALDAALTSDRPIVVDVVADPTIPPLPPHVSAKQARAYLTALASGDPEALKVVRASVKQMFA
jgi:pyruvate dehydrogenase (quinone)